MKRRNIAIVSILVLVVAAVPLMWNARFTLISIAGLVLNKFRTAHDPAGTLTLELRESPTVEADPVRPSAQPDTNAADWPSYNRTLSADRFSPLNQINTRNVGALKVLCTYDTGVAVDAAPIVTNGLVIIDNAGGDNKGVKGRVCALAADTGKVVWETYLVPRSPGDPIRGPQGVMPDKAAETWANDTNAKLPLSGAALWTSFSLDMENGHLYWESIWLSFCISAVLPTPRIPFLRSHSAFLSSAWSCSALR